MKSVGHVGGRLSMSSVLSHNTSLDASSVSSLSQTNSASLAKAERQIKALRDENSKLRKDLENVRSLYQQLTSENSHEKFDERRITLLKSQVIQLERQILLLSEAIGSRTTTLTEVENSLIQLADRWRYYIGLDVKGPDVSVPRADMIQMVHIAESARIKLFKNIENATTEKLFQPVLCMNEFLKPAKKEEISFLDIASGKLEHINLKHVTKLETKLASLYKEMISLHEVLETKGDYMEEEHRTTSNHITMAVKDRLNTRILKSCAMMKDCCGDLLYLSLLYPCAPWSVFKRSAIKDITTENVMKSMPHLPKSKVADVQNTVEALLKTVNFRSVMQQHEVKSLKEELKFHKSIYDIQLSYIQSLFSVIREGYKKFEASSDEVIAKPFKEILEAYTVLKTDATEEALKLFLTRFDKCFEKLDHAVTQLSLSDRDVSEEFSKFGENFLRDLDKKIASCQHSRDKAVNEREGLKRQQEDLEQELRKYLDEQELKYKEHFVAEPESVRSLPVKDDLVIYMKQTPDTDVGQNDENIVYVESALTDLSLDGENSKKDNKKTTNSRSRKVAKESSKMLSMDINGKSTCDAPIPPKSKETIKSKKKMVPSSFVPNRTLHLRRSGSLSSLDNSSLCKDKHKQNEFLSGTQKNSSGTGPSEFVQGTGNSVKNGPQSRSQSRHH